MGELRLADWESAEPIEASGGAWLRQEAGHPHQVECNRHQVARQLGARQSAVACAAKPTAGLSGQLDRLDSQLPADLVRNRLMLG